MSNPKNSTGLTIAQTTDTPSLAVSTPSTTENVVSKPTNQKPVNLQEVFERLKAGNQKQKMYEEFFLKLDNVKNFRESFDGGGLLMVISNPISGNEITISNLDLILSTVDKSIKMGNDVKERIEVELLQMGI
ncbi:hypothetical protein [Emticicia sp.]|uniref:hypothetical protein n=1 Tax=Emticicia sp. TaxID=1930953 RepID=UPI003751518C